MATSVASITESLNREINVPGFPQFPDIDAGDMLGYVEDGFWEGRLMGVFKGWTIVAGSTLTSPESGNWITDTGGSEEDFSEEDQMFLVIIAGFRLLQRKALNLAQNYRAQAGPVEYEVQMSATVLRELLQSFERRLKVYAELYSELISAEVFVYMDGVAQSSYAMVAGLPEMTVRY